MREHNTTGSSLTDTWVFCDAKIELFGSGDNQIENKFAVADYKHHHHTTLLLFPHIARRTAVLSNIHLAADERQKDRRPGWSSGGKLLTQIKKMETSLSHKSPQSIRAADVTRSTLVPRAEHATTCMSP